MSNELNSEAVQALLGNIMRIAQADEGTEAFNENANKAVERIPVMRDIIAGEVYKFIAKEYILPKDVVAAHESGEIHYHDLDYAPLAGNFNCMVIDLRNMLENGFKMGDAEIETPKSIATAANVTAQIIAQVASHIYGGNTINRIDEVLAPYVRVSYNKHFSHYLQVTDGNKEKAGILAREKTEKETYDAMQSLEYEINTLN